MKFSLLKKFKEKKDILKKIGGYSFVILALIGIVNIKTQTVHVYSWGGNTADIETKIQANQAIPSSDFVQALGETSNCPTTYNCNQYVTAYNNGANAFNAMLGAYNSLIGSGQSTSLEVTAILQSINAMNSLNTQMDTDI